MARLLVAIFCVALAWAATNGTTIAPPEPTKAPTAAPTEAPTAAPTKAPTAAPTKAPTAAPTDAPTEPPKPCPCDVCFTSWREARGKCEGSFFQKFVCKFKAFDTFGKCWFKECIVSTEACASRPFPDIDDF